MSLHTSENVRCFFECEWMNFSIFWHHHEQSPDLTSGYILKLASNHKFSINQAVSWILGLFSLRHFGHFSKITYNFQSFFHFGAFLYDWKWHYDQTDLSFFGHSKKTSVYDRIIPEKTGWNTVKKNVFNFSVNCIGNALHGCCFLGRNCLKLHPIRTMFFNELIQFSVVTWAVEQIPTLRQHNSTMFFVSWLASLQHKSTEPLLKYVSVVSSS